jgi:hypothetical protein
MANLPVPQSIYSPGPPSHSFPITPSDVTQLPECTLRIYVGTGGTLAVVMNEDGADAPVTFTVASGTFYKLAVSQVLATGTSATGLVGLN